MVFRNSLCVPAIFLAMCGRVEYELLPKNTMDATDSEVGIDSTSSGDIDTDTIENTDRESDSNIESDTTVDTDTQLDSDSDTEPFSDTSCSGETPDLQSHYYPDCDGDGMFGSNPTRACDVSGASAIFDCIDGRDPDGGWSTARGDDCNDEDSTGNADTSWYPDCDGDGSFSTIAIIACGMSGANAGYNCQDGKNPDGGWSSVQGSDCSDDMGDATCWYGAEWPYRRKITILASSVAGTQNFFPVLIRKTLATWKGPNDSGHVAQTDGGDFVFTDDDGKTKLSHEIEEYAYDTGTLVAWVKVPVVSALSDSIIYIYYGNSRAGLANQWNAAEVWDDGGNNYFRGVWHLAETGTGKRLDSTQFGNHCNALLYDGDEAVTGIIGGADRLDGNSDSLNCGRQASLNIRNNVTVSIWMRPQGSRVVKDKWDDGPWKIAYGLYLYGTSNTLTTLGADFMISGKRQDIWDKGSIDIPPGSWSYLVVTYDGSDLRAFVNGVRDYIVSMPGTVDDSSGVDLTVSLDEGGDKGLFNGVIDEIRVSSTKRSANWITTCYNNQNDPGSFFTIAGEIQK